MYIFIISEDIFTNGIRYILYDYHIKIFECTILIVLPITLTNMIPKLS